MQVWNAKVKTICNKKYVNPSTEMPEFNDTSPSVLFFQQI